MIKRLSAAALAVTLLAPAAFARNEITVKQEGNAVLFYTSEPFGKATINVTGPKRYDLTKNLKEDNFGYFKLGDGAPEPRDGAYNWSFSYTSIVDPDLQKLIDEARKEDNFCFVDELIEEGKFESGTFSGTFLVIGGQIMLPEEEEEPKFNGDDQDVTPAKTAEQEAEKRGGHAKDFVINDDLIVDGSACIGFDCVNGESFSFDTIRLKENNLRIKFDDTSVAASFPRNDWQLTANASANGGASKFSIDDITGNRTPFTVEAGARSHSLYVDDGGRIGIRTSTPSTEIHVIDGDSPTLRLQQDGSSGFAPQTWDIAGNETNFFVRDVTNGSQLPFRIRPSAPTSSIFIDEDGHVGMNTASPDANLHVVKTTSGASIMMRLTNNGRTQMELQNTNVAAGSGSVWRYDVNNGGIFSILASDLAVTNIALQLTPSGDATITGSLTTAMNNYPDYVFKEGYELMPLDDLAQFIDANGHLPNVQSEEDVEFGKKVNISELQRSLLEKVEELTLYTLQQHETDKELRSVIANQNDLIEKLESRLAALESGQ